MMGEAPSGGDMVPLSSAVLLLRPDVRFRRVNA